MAKLKLPLLSKSAHGQFGKKLNYYTKAGKTYTRKFHFPKRPPTGAQLSRRYITGLLTIRWQTMTEDERLPYKQGAELESKKTGLGISGFNYFVKVASSDLVTHLGLVVFYPMNEGTGRQVNNFVGNFCHGTFAPAFPAPGLEWVKSKNDLFGTCLKSDGTNKFFTSSYDSRLNITKQFSVSFFLSLNSFDSAIQFLVRRTGVFQITMSVENILTGIVTTNLGSPNVKIANSLLTVGKMSLITLTYDSTLATANLKIYLDNKLIQSANHNGDIVQNTNFLTCFAAANNFRLTNCRMDNIMIFKRALLFSEVQKIHDLMSEPKQRQKYFE